MSPRTKWTATCELDIRNAILDSLVEIDLKPKTDKPFINLSLGDPTKNPLLQPHKVVVDAVNTALHSGKYNGYGPVDGLPESKAALAQFYSAPNEGLEYALNDVVLTNGASEALDIVITVLCKPGSNILFPRPGFAYSVSTNARHVEDRYYNLLPEKEWEVDLDHVESLIDENTAAIVITNPSNPCGSNFSRAHLEAILAFAAKHYLPVISDEIYGELVFAGEHFYPVANLNAASSSPVPVLTIGGLAKRWLVPGWRLGWILAHDPAGHFGFDVRQKLKDCASVALAPCALTQGALPAILRDTPREFYAHVCRVVERNARLVADRLAHIDGLKVVSPKGSLYVMVGVETSKFEGVKDEWDFVQKLVWEEAVFPVPGKCFRFEGYMRIVTASKEEDLVEACTRLEAFCERHRCRQ